MDRHEKKLFNFADAQFEVYAFSTAPIPESIGRWGAFHTDWILQREEMHRELELVNCEPTAELDKRLEIVL